MSPSRKDGRAPVRPGEDGWIDWPRFRELATDCSWTPRELARFYLDGTREQLTELRTALATGDATAVERLAHGCVGSSATCGINGMVDLFRRLEEAADDGGRAAELLAECTVRLQAIAEVLAGGDAG